MYSLFPEADTLLNSNTSTLSNRGTWDEHCVHCFQHQSPTAEEGDEKDEMDGGPEGVRAECSSLCFNLTCHRKTVGQDQMHNTITCNSRGSVPMPDLGNKQV